MNSHEIRKKFLDFFAKNGHEVVGSSSLIPAQDPTLLFTNAGMNQFKDLFLGLETRAYKRATTVQKCVRAGGKHNDLDNVGFTKRHLTFFEMMGNFSFGDYFKKEAIQYAWNFLTKEIKLDANKLHASVFQDDDESYVLWQNSINLPTDRIHRLAAEHNFWQMGDTGPCGPCTEIYIDRGAEYGHANLADCGPGCDCDRFLEIWNLVFMQYDRQQDGSLKPLKQTGVDTGMGLERLTAVIQDKDSVFTTDLFAHIIEKTEQLTNINYTYAQPEIRAAFNVIADHIRSSTFIIADGCAPTNDGRGYVLRKIIRRAALFAQKLTDKNIFPELSRVVVADMGDVYPELVKNADLVFTILKSEIEKFAANLVRGKAILDRYIQETNNTKKITGEQAFKLYDTYGFPIELVGAYAREHGYTVDAQEFEQHMHKQQEQSGKKIVDPLSHLDLQQTTEFTGYNELETQSRIIGLVHDGKLVDSIPAEHTIYVIAEKSPFFIVGGGQVPDQGWLVINDIITPILEARFINNAIAARIKTPCALSIGDAVISRVDAQWRTNAMKNHTGTHLLQAALIELFGKQIQQSGSLVHPDYLRFDFTYHKQLSTEDIKQVEDLVNEKIRANIPVTVTNCSLKEAQQHGALAFFGEKYKPEKVRMITVDTFSIELCGGTHVPSTGAIGTFKITESTALSAGHRRIVAVTGPKAIDLFQETFNTLKTLGQDFKVKREEVLDAVLKQKEHTRQLQHEIKQLRHELIAAQVPTWHNNTVTINTIPFLFLSIADMTQEDIRSIAAVLLQQKPGFYFIISTTNNQTIFYGLLAPEYTNTIDLKQFAELLKTHGLRGGVIKNTIQGGGGIYPQHLEQEIKEWIEKQ